MKQFCFEFYPGEVLRQIRFFNQEQKACYLDVISAHIENMRFSERLLDKITSGLNEEEKVEFMQIFDRDESGFFIGWVASAIEKRTNYIESRSRNKTGKTKNIPTSHENDMVNVDVNVNVKEKEFNKKVQKKQKANRPGSVEEVTQFFKELGLNGKSEFEAQDFWDWYTNANWSQGKAKTPLVDWTAAARRWARPKLSEIDKTKNAQNKSRTIDYSQYKKPITK